jgi:hypothetical protein
MAAILAQIWAYRIGSRGPLILRGAGVKAKRAELAMHLASTSVTTAARSPIAGRYGVWPDLRPIGCSHRPGTSRRA